MYSLLIELNGKDIFALGMSVWWHVGNCKLSIYKTDVDDAMKTMRLFISNRPLPTK